MLFLMFETLEHAPALNPENTAGYEPEWAQEYRNQMQNTAENEADGM